MTADIEIKFEVDLSEPNEELIAYATQHLNEDPATRDQVLRNFRTLILEKGGCKSSRTDDYFLLKFLRAKLFDIKEAYKALVHYQTYKIKHKKYYSDVKFERIRIIGETNLIGTQPFLDGSGRRIGIFKMGGWDPEKVTVTELFQCATLLAELALLEQRSQILGGVIIFDLAGINMSHIKQVTPTIIHQAMQAILHIYPVMGHAVHVVNDTPVFKTGYAIAKPFLNKDMKSRLFFHGTDMSSLHKHIEPKYLPECYGGIHPDYGYSRWISHLLTNKVALEELRLSGYDLEDQIRSLGEF